MDASKIKTKFRELFGGQARLFRSPGRINIIGEHTDYNEGFVMPAAVDKEIVFAIKPNGSNTFQIHSLDTNERIHFDLDTLQKKHSNWSAYIIGIIDQLIKKGNKIPAFDAVFGGDIPIGAGMSSSAALSCVAAFALNEVYNLALDKHDIIHLAQKAEQDYAGVNCGIMDQFASVFSKKDKAIKLDCYDLSYEYIDLKMPSYEFVLVNSMVKHELANTAYNDRRNECAEVISHFRKSSFGIKSLRDISLTQLENSKNEMDLKIYKRAKYVLEENTRVNEAARVMNAGDYSTLGSLLYASHEGLQKQYEVSCEELDFLVDTSKNTNGVLGSRMMGGGFGGCTINLVKSKEIEAFKNVINDAFYEKYQINPEIYSVHSDGGSSEIVEAYD